MIAGEPAHINRIAKGADALKIVGIDPLAGGPVMKTVAQRDQTLRLEPGNHFFQERQSGAGVVGRDVQAGLREA